MDEHDGSITSLATVFIAILTFFLVQTSSEQWQTMARQLKDSEAAQAASLSIQGLHIENFPKNPRVVYDVKNAGATRADRITPMIASEAATEGARAREDSWPSRRVAARRAIRNRRKVALQRVWRVSSSRNTKGLVSSVLLPSS
jgi:hypothetical protein